jgi:predicted HicB family RNase H-like nuclease
MKYITAKDYLKIVEWSDRDKCFIGSALPIIGQCCHGKDEAKVYGELCQIVEEWVQIHKEDGRPLPEPTVGKKFSGKFIVRTTPEIHKILTVRALASGDSLNTYVQKALVAVTT